MELSALRANICAEIVERVGNTWDEMFGRLLLFRDTHVHCRVPIAYKDKKLANWVSNQRALAIKGLLSTVRKRRLDAIGFEWDPFETDWAEGFHYLTIYKAREGHCRVPATHKVRWLRLSEQNFRVDKWSLCRG